MSTGSCIHIISLVMAKFIAISKPISYRSTGIPANG